MRKASIAAMVAIPLVLVVGAVIYSRNSSDRQLQSLVSYGRPKSGWSQR